MLVRDGVPVELDRHLARLSASLEVLYGETLPRDAPVLISDAARSLELERLRLTVVPASSGLELDLRTAPVDGALVFPAWEHAVSLRRLVVPGGLGGHKWADRDLLDAAESGLAGAVALLVDADGSVLEASRANVFAIHGTRVVTPPADGRILPGITRRLALDLASEVGLDAREENVVLEWLLDADEVFLTGAVRGIEPVRQLEELRSWTPGEWTRVLSDGLSAIWTERAGPLARAGPGS
jgi:para-aminobenzoate synthetase/4-amino-4-deoxychorismate lyase